MGAIEQSFEWKVKDTGDTLCHAGPTTTPARRRCKGTENTMSTDVFEDYLERLEFEFDVDNENSAIDIHAETQDGHAVVVTLVITRSAYTLFVSPFVEYGEDYDDEELHRRLLELSDRNRYVKLSLDGDGDIKLSAEGFSRLDAFGQFRRRLEAIVNTLDKYGQEIADLADGELL